MARFDDLVANSLRDRFSLDIIQRYRSQAFGLFAKDAPVAQLDRAPDYESGGQEFESLRARQFLRY